MDTTHAQPLSRLELQSATLLAAGRIAQHLQLQLEHLAEDLPVVAPTASRLLADLDTCLVDDLATGVGTYLSRAATARDLADRYALLNLCRHVGADLAVPSLPAMFTAPPRKRRLTELELVVVRGNAVELAPRHACIIGGLEAGGAAVELANATNDGLDETEAGGWILHVPGARDASARGLLLPAWVGPAAARLAASKTGMWLLHDSRSLDRDSRTSTLLMAAREVLAVSRLPWPTTVTAESVRRTALSLLVEHRGPAAWDRAVAAAGTATPPSPIGCSGSPTSGSRPAYRPGVADPRQAQ